MKMKLRNFLDGAKTILNLLPEEDPRLTHPIRSYRTDAEALASDWKAVGGDMRRAMGRIDHETAGINHELTTAR